MNHFYLRGSKSHKNPCEFIDLYTHICLTISIYNSAHTDIYVYVCTYMYVFFLYIDMWVHKIGVYVEFQVSDAIAIHKYNT